MNDFRLGDSRPNAQDPAYSSPIFFQNRDWKIMLGVFLDTETSGLDPFVHVPLELAFVIVDLFSGRELAAYETLLQVDNEAWVSRDVNSVAINGLTREELDRGSTRSQAAKEIEGLFSDHHINNDRAFFICQNVVTCRDRNGWF